MARRATSVEELEVVLNHFFDEGSFQRGLAFKPRPDDIIISPYAKCGTTWLQQIAHSLRTRGSMDFEEITAVTPWIEIAHDLGWDLEAPQEAAPRVFKSHLSWDRVPKGARYICSFRDCEDALISFYRFFEGWMFEPGAISLEEILHWRWPRAELDQKGYWFHLASWWEQRRNPDVLLLCYEDMKADLPGTVRRVARFMGIPLDQELLEIVVRQSSLDFMLAHRRQFDSHLEREVGDRRAGLPPAIDSDKVTPGAADRARYRLAPALKDRLERYWQEQIGARFGLPDYDSLRRALRELHEEVGRP